MNTKNTTRKGFTTVELVIVIAVIAILAVVLVPTFSGLIAKANLSADKQAVRNMNVCLASSEVLYNDPSDSGNIRAYLREYGYGKEDNFKTRSANHRICWYVGNTENDGKSVILLVNDAEDTVVYPEEYTGLRFADDGLILGENLFDLSLPLMKTDKNLNPDSVPFNGGSFSSVDISVKYTFIADTEYSEKYNNWKASFYVSADLPDGKDKVDLLFVGCRKDDPDVWKLCRLDDVEEGVLVDLLVDTELVGDLGLTYGTDIQNVIKEFECGVVSTNWSVDYGEYGIYNLYEQTFASNGYDNPTGTVLKVELRLTNPDDATDQVVLGVFEYQFQ